MHSRKIKRFYRPNIITISLAFLCLGLTLKFILPTLSMVNIIPCKMYEPEHMSLCPVNPNPDASTHYLGFSIGDHIYMIIYFLFIIIFVPYTMACTIFYFYFNYIKKLIRR